MITTRPVEVLSATTVTYNGVTYPLSMSTLKDFNAIPVPTGIGIPNTMHVFPNAPDITIGLWPAPNHDAELVEHQADYRHARADDTLIAGHWLPAGD